MNNPEQTVQLRVPLLCPFQWETLPQTIDAFTQQRQLQELGWLLRALPPADGHSESANADWQRLEAKLDLSLMLLQRSLHPQLPPSQSIALSGQSLSWSNPAPLAIGETGALHLLPDASLAMPLTLPASIQHCEPQADQWLCTAGWAPLPEALQNAFDRLLFKLHRRHLKQQHG
jgi:hypothetical protein